MQVFAAPRLQQLEDVDRSSSGGDEEAVGVGGELELVGWRQQLGHFGDLGAGRTQRWQPPHCHPQSPRVTLATPAPQDPAAPQPSDLPEADAVPVTAHAVQMEAGGCGVADPGATG